MGDRGALLLFLFLMSWYCSSLVGGGLPRMKRQGPSSEYAILFTPFASLTLLMDLPHEYIAVRNSDLSMCYYVSIMSRRRSALAIAAHIFKHGISAFQDDFAVQQVPWSWVQHNTAAGPEVNFCKSTDHHVLLQSFGDALPVSPQGPQGPPRGSRPPPNGENPPVG